jgi:DNA repair protein RadC
MAKPIGIAVHDHIIVGKHELGVLLLKIVGQSGWF